VAQGQAERAPIGAYGKVTITGKTRVVGVWGYPVGHSRSPAMHNAAIEALGLDWVYVPFAVAPEAVAAAVAGIRALDLVGVNVTVPLKREVIPYLDEVAPDAARIGSVNTIVNRAGHLSGHSTDGPGFLWDLERRNICPDGRSVLLWGAGGSARAVAVALASRGCRISIANRTLARAQELANLAGAGAKALDCNAPSYAQVVADAEILVNTTSLGMAPALVDEMPSVSDGALHAGQIVYDLVYVPDRTRLLVAAEAAGCQTIGGLGMLICQGAVSLSIWAGIPLVDVPLDKMETGLGL